MHDSSDDRPTSKSRTLDTLAPRAPRSAPVAEDTIVDLSIPDEVRSAWKRASAPGIPVNRTGVHSGTLASSAVGQARGSSRQPHPPFATLRGGTQAPVRSVDPQVAPTHPDVMPLSAAQQEQTLGARAQIPAVSGGASERAKSLTYPILRKADPAQTLFRDEALRAYQSDHAITGVLRTETVGGWTGFLLLALAVSVALGVAALGHVDLTAHARGVLQTPQGTAMVSAAVDGTLTKLLVSVGQTVREGDVLAEIDSKSAEAELMRASRALEALKERARTETSTLDPLKQEAVALLERRAVLTRRRLKSQGGDASRLERRKATYGELTLSGAVSRSDVDQVTDLLSGAHRTSLSLLDQLTDLESQLTAIKRQDAERKAAQAQEEAQAETQLAAAQLLAEQTRIRAPRDGRIESLLISQGDSVRPGTLITQVVPTQAPRRAVVFIPERDRAFLESGRLARVEFDRLPRGEFGTVTATVIRVAREIAPPSEVARYLGDDELKGAYVRVDLALTDERVPLGMRKHLESGAKLTARVPLRKRRFLALVFDPVRRWLD